MNVIIPQFSKFFNYNIFNLLFRHLNILIMYDTIKSILNIYKEDSIMNKHYTQEEKEAILKEYLCSELENIITILKSAGYTVNAPLCERYDVIKEMSDTYSITTLCEALNVAKGSYYNHIFRSKENIIPHILPWQA